MNSQMLSSSMQRCAVAPRATVRTSACPLLRPVAQMRGLAQHPHAKAFTSYTQTKLHAQLTSSKTPRSSRRGVCVVAARSEAAIDEEDTPKIATEFITQALFNYFSCSAVAIATQVGGSNAALVTFLMIAAHMVLVPLIAYVGAPASGAHFNPIITFSFMITGIMKVKTGIQYIIAQCVGGVLGAYAAFNLLPTHRLLEATSQKTGALDAAEEHQRILAELEEVHSLRERMLQQAGTYVPTNAEAPAPVPPPTEESPSALTEEAPPSESSGGGT